MRSKHLLACVSGVVIASFAGPALGGEDARTIMDKSKKVQRVEIASRVHVLMADSSGKKRERRFENRAKKFEGVWKTYTKFTAPQDVAGTQFLVLENKGDTENDLHLYEPIAKRTRRIAPAQRAGRFVGTDFYYEDIDIFDVDEDVHTFVREEKLTLSAGPVKESFDCWVIESTPKSGKATTYSKTITWVQKSNYYPRQVEMFSDEALTKRFRAFQIKKDGDKWVPILTEMDDLKAKSETISQTETYDLNAKAIVDKIFTESYLLGGG
jgi:hypothetical protein